jgi:hypothetical protein
MNEIIARSRTKGSPKWREKTMMITCSSKPDHYTFEIKHYIIRDEVQKGESVSPIHISTDEQIRKHFGKASILDERVCVLKLELVETTSLLKKEVMSPRLGGSTDMLLIDGQSFFSSKNGPKCVESFLFGKWIEISDEHRFPIVVNMGNGPDC